MTRLSSNFFANPNPTEMQEDDKWKKQYDKVLAQTLHESQYLHDLTTLKSNPSEKLSREEKDFIDTVIFFRETDMLVVS